MIVDSNTILLVEDNPDDVALTLRAFGKSRIANVVTVARDGVEALQLLYDRDVRGDLPALPHLVLLDLKLPKIDGLEVLRRIRGDDRTRLLPVVILTSSDEQQDIVQGYDLGANSFIRKPVDLDQFMTAIDTLGLYWLVLNRIPRHMEPQ